jgi:hypothetical protein
MGHRPVLTRKLVQSDLPQSVTNPVGVTAVDPFILPADYDRVRSAYWPPFAGAHINLFRTVVDNPRRAPINGRVSSLRDHELSGGREPPSTGELAITGNSCGQDRTRRISRIDVPRIVHHTLMSVRLGCAGHQA